MEVFAGLPMLPFDSASDWRGWLDTHHAQAAGLWLKIAKKSTSIPTVSYAEALDEALCYGWIDGQKRSYDEQYFLQKFTPRRPKSIWSKVNIEKIAALTAAGRLMPAGLAAVEAAQGDGRWAAAYDSPSASTVPEDLLQALDLNPKAKDFFETLNKTNRYAITWRLQTTKKPDIRAARIAAFVAMLERGEKLH